MTQGHEPTTTEAEGRLVRRWTVVVVILLIHIPLELAGRAASTHGMVLAFGIAGAMASAAALVLLVSAVTAWARSPRAWTQYRWADRLPHPTPALSVMALAALLGNLALVLTV